MCVEFDIASLFKALYVKVQGNNFHNYYNLEVKNECIFSIPLDVFMYSLIAFLVVEMSRFIHGAYNKFLSHAVRQRENAVTEYFGRLGITSNLFCF